MKHINVISSPRTLLQLPHPAVADGLFPSHTSHLPPKAHIRHDDQGGQTRGRPRTHLSAHVAQLGSRMLFLSVNVQRDLISWALSPMQPKSSVIELLEEMISKFQEDPPLSSSITGQKDPQELLAFVNNLQINESTSLETALFMRTTCHSTSFSFFQFQVLSDTTISRSTKSLLSEEGI